MVFTLAGLYMSINTNLHVVGDHYDGTTGARLYTVRKSERTKLPGTNTHIHTHARTHTHTY
jgi:hypothetical protein